MLIFHFIETVTIQHMRPFIRCTFLLVWPISITLHYHQIWYNDLYSIHWRAYNSKLRFGILKKRHIFHILFTNSNQIQHQTFGANISYIIWTDTYSPHFIIYFGFSFFGHSYLQMCDLMKGYYIHILNFYTLYHIIWGKCYSWSQKLFLLTYEVITCVLSISAAN